MTIPKVTEITRNGNPIGKRPVARQSDLPATAAQNPSHYQKPTTTQKPSCTAR